MYTCFRCGCVVEFGEDLPPESVLCCAECFVKISPMLHALDSVQKEDDDE